MIGYYLDLLALRGSAGLLGTLLPLLGFTAFNSVNSEFDAGRCVLGGSVGDGGGWDVLIAALGGTALSSYIQTKEHHHQSSHTCWMIRVNDEEALPETFSAFLCWISEPFLLLNPQKKKKQNSFLLKWNQQEQMVSKQSKLQLDSRLLQELK